MEPETDRLVNRILLVVGVVGFIITAYLEYIGFFHDMGIVLAIAFGGVSVAGFLRSATQASVRGLGRQVVGVQQEVAGVQREVAGVKQEVAAVKQEVAGVKQEVAGVKQEVAAVKQEVAGVKQEVVGLRQDFARAALTLERIEAALLRLGGRQPGD